MPRFFVDQPMEGQVFLGGEEGGGLIPDGLYL